MEGRVPSKLRLQQTLLLSSTSARRVRLLYETSDSLRRGCVGDTELHYDGGVEEGPKEGKGGGKR